MFEFPIQYDTPLFRPPGEANSLILQPTVGCSWNKCAFCEMYASKKFRLKPMDDILGEIGQIARIFPDNRKFFLADGNAMVMSTKKLMQILLKINNSFKKIQRISLYALPSDIRSKTQAELAELREAGLKLVYIGIESGDDEILKMVNKGETYQSTLEGIQKAHNAGIDTSCMIINGLGGKLFSMQHALNSAKIVNACQPKFLSMLTLSLPYGLPYFAEKFNGEYEPISVFDILKELRLFISKTNLKGTIFRSDHISNFIPLKGILDRNKADLVHQIDKQLIKSEEKVEV